MRAWAVIIGGIIVNTVIADRDLHASHGGDEWVDITDTVPQPQIRWTYVDGVFSPPAP